jgi:hypothetical protein
MPLSISLFVSRKATSALFGNLESPTLEVQFLVTMVGFFSFFVKYLAHWHSNTNENVWSLTIPQKVILMDDNNLNNNA